MLGFAAIRHPLTIRPVRRRRRSGHRMGTAGDRELRELMSAADVGRTVSRIAHQIIEKTALDDPSESRQPVVLLGIPTCGVTLADRLAALVDEVSGWWVTRGSLGIHLHSERVIDYH